jgi:hypothetical protein
VNKIIVFVNNAKPITGAKMLKKTPSARRLSFHIFFKSKPLTTALIL